ncbi:hypothetical protein VULLAG_LOCUS12192 [Vulpes lagopus]
MVEERHISSVDPITWGGCQSGRSDRTGSHRNESLCSCPQMAYFFKPLLSLQKRRNLLHTGVSLPNSGELFIMKTVLKKRMAREKGLMYLKF